MAVQRSLEPIAVLRSVTCHAGSHGVTCHPTQVNATRLNPSQADRYSIYRTLRIVRLSWPWLCTDHRLYHGAVSCGLQRSRWTGRPSAETGSDAVTTAEDLRR